MAKRKLSTSLCAEYANWSKEQLISHIKKLEKGETFFQNSQSAKANARRRKEPRPFNFGLYPSQRIALKIAYFGWNYNGFAAQISYKPDGKEAKLPDNPSVVTVEDVLFKALLKTRLIESPRTCEYSRCGRTDTGVSSTSQIVSLVVRSSATQKTPAALDADQESVLAEAKDLEIPICSMLNRILPDDIRILGYSLVHDDSFNARFSCNGRKYRYFFNKHQLDIDKMSEAARDLLGTHDFRNFCRRDPSKKITNYTRTIFECEIREISDGYCYFQIHGSAFLYHQVRCTMELLFLVGRGVEGVDLIKALLDIHQFPEPPRYELANELPLVLIGADYPEKFGLDFKFDGCKDDGATDTTSNGDVVSSGETVLFSVLQKLYHQHHVKCLTVGLLEGVGRARLPDHYKPFAGHPKHPSIIKK